MIEEVPANFPIMTRMQDITLDVGVSNNWWPVWIHLLSKFKFDLLRSVPFGDGTRRFMVFAKYKNSTRIRLRLIKLEKHKSITT